MHRVLSLLLGLLHCCSLSDDAYLSPLGNICPCVPPCTDYGIVITPRGNYSTLKMSVYKFDLKNGSLLRPSDIDKVKTYPNKVSIDLNKIFNESETISTAIMPLVQAAKKVVPVAFHLTTPIFFSIDERTKAVNQDAWFKVLGNVLVLFANKTVPFLTGPYSVKDNYDYNEASYKWQLVNFLLDNFHENKKTVAVLSFNGKMETEISYEKRMIDQTVKVISTIKGESHAIVTSTFFKKGSSYALYKYFDAISSPGTTLIKSPCGPKGLRKQFKGMYTVKWIVGTGDIKKCRKIIRENLLSICDKVNGCPFLKGRIKGKILAFPNVASTMEQLGYNECTDDFTPEMLDGAIRRVCGVKSIPAMKIPAKNGAAAYSKRATFRKHTPRSIINCVNGNFLYLMLTEGYHLSKNTKIRIQKNKISGLPLDPSLGELMVKMALL